MTRPVPIVDAAVAVEPVRSTAETELAETSRRWRAQPAVWSLAVAVALTLPHVVNSFWLALFTQSLVWMLGTLSVVVLYRATTAVSLCQASIMGISANAATWLSLERGWALPWALATGALVAVPVGLVLVLPALRLRGIELTVLTLMVAMATDALVFAGGAPLRASDFGLALSGREIAGIDFGDRTSAYYASLVIVGLVIGLTLVVLRGRIGRTWIAIQTGQAVAASSGIDVARYKMVGFAMSTLIAGLAGSLLLLTQGAADASSFNVIVSIRMVVVAMIGGIESPISAILGGLANGVGLRLPGELGLSGPWLDLVLGIAVIIAILRRRPSTSRRQRW